MSSPPAPALFPTLSVTVTLMGASVSSEAGTKMEMLAEPLVDPVDQE
jgi:hypothetical protein